MHLARTTQNAKRLRRHQTDAERLLWFRFRDRRLSGCKFKRQVPIGGYVVDFFCPEAKLIVELDSGQHSGEARDAARTKELEAFGYLVIRFWNHEVMQNIEGVIEAILSTLNQQPPEPPHPTPLPHGEREPN